jgi:hypothetical protein
MSTTKSNFVVALFLGVVIWMPSADARITRIVIDRVESPTFGNASFGNVGQYEKLVGRAYGELDLRDELNSGIVYIDKAPLNAAKRVEYSTDVLILKPIDMSHSNRTVLYDVVNRGDTRALAVFHIGASASNDPRSEKDAGDGFLMKQGYTVVASGWQGDVPAGDNRLVGHFPVATETGAGRLRSSSRRSSFSPRPLTPWALGMTEGVTCGLTPRCRKASPRPGCCAELLRSPRASSFRTATGRSEGARTART